MEIIGKVMLYIIMTCCILGALASVIKEESGLFPILVGQFTGGVAGILVAKKIALPLAQTVESGSLSRNQGKFNLES